MYFKTLAFEKIHNKVTLSLIQTVQTFPESRTTLNTAHPRQGFTMRFRLRRVEWGGRGGHYNAPAPLADVRSPAMR